MLASLKPLSLLLSFLLAACAHTFMVTRVVDGDTVVLSDDRKIRLIGVDTPELHESEKLERDIIHTRRDKATIQALGEKAAEFTRKLVEGKEVRVRYGRQKEDRYGRTLAYLYLRDGTFVNEEIIRRGFGNAYIKFPFRHMKKFQRDEKTARESRRGLWGKDGGP